MVQLLIKVLVNAVAIWVAAAVVPGVEVTGERDDLGTTVLTLVVIGAIFGVVNAVIKFLVPFDGCLGIVTLGIASLLINALILMLTAWLSDQVGISFTIDDFFWSAILAALVVSFVSLVLNLVLPDDD